MPQIYIISGPDKGHSFELRRDITTIGRGPDAEICLRDKTVSRKHAQIMKRWDKYVLKDLGSKNGTYIDGRRILAGTSHEIREYDRIAIGDTVFSVGKPFADVVKDSLDSIDLFKAPNGQETGTTLDVMKRGRTSKNRDDLK